VSPTPAAEHEQIAPRAREEERLHVVMLTDRCSTCKKNVLAGGGERN
jgi:hypothetical protein